MMFLLDIAFVLEVAVAGFGLYLLHLAEKEKSKCLKNTGWFVVVAVGLTALCTTYYGITYWNRGYFQHPHPSHQMMSGMGQGMGQHMGTMTGGGQQGMMGKMQACMSQMQGKMMEPKMMEQMKGCMMQGMMGKGEMGTPGTDKKPMTQEEHESHH